MGPQKPEFPDRYSRHTSLPRFGAEGQRRLREACFLLIGCGALGSAAAMRLAGAGAGRLILVDFDTIDVSNLQRQIAYTEADCGLSKAETLASRVAALNSGVEVTVINRLADEKLLRGLLPGCDFAIEGSDNPATKYLVSRLCEETETPVCIGGVREFEGQATTWTPGHALYSDFFPPSGEDTSFLPCGIGGVFGPLPGIIGGIQAAEAIKCVARCGSLLTDRLLRIDCLDWNVAVFSL